MNAHSSYLAHLLSQSEGLLFHVLYVVLGLRVQSGGPFVGLQYLGGSVVLRKISVHVQKLGVGLGEPLSVFSNSGSKASY